jgi:hypothetical protein
MITSIQINKIVSGILLPNMGHSHFSVVGCNKNMTGK